MAGVLMTDVPLVTAPGPQTVLSQDLHPGVVVRYHDQNVEILREKEDDPNRFGLPWFRYWARLISSGKTGYIGYGPDAIVTIIEQDGDTPGGRFRA